MITFNEFKKLKPDGQKHWMMQYSELNAEFARQKLGMQKLKLATMYFAQAIVLKPEPNLMLEQGETYEKMFQYDEAFSCFNKAANQKNLKAVIKRINYTKQHSIVEAKEYLGKQLPHFRILWFEYRKYCFILQNYQESFTNDDQFLEYMKAKNNQNDVDKKQKKDILHSFYISGNQNEALQWLRTLTLHDTQSLSYLYLYATLLISLSRIEEAMLCLNYSISKSDTIDNYILLARIKCLNLNQQNLQASINLLQSRILNLPEVVLDEITNILNYAEDKENQEIFMDTQGINFYNQIEFRCETMYKLEDYKKLINFCISKINQQGASFMLYDFLAKSYFELRQYNKFLENCELMSQQENYSIIPYIYKCKHYLREQNFDLFQQNFQQAIELQPQSTDIHYIKLEYQKYMRDTKGILNTIVQINTLDSKQSINQLMSIHLFDYQLEDDIYRDCLKKEKIIQNSLLENGVNNTNFYQLKILQQWTYYLLNNQFSFIQYLLHLKVIIIGFTFYLFQDTFIYYLEDQFYHQQIEYPDYSNLYNYIQTQFKFKKLELFQQFSQQRYKFEYELGLVSDYHYQKLLLKQQPQINILDKYQLQNYFQSSREANQAIQDGIAIFQAIKQKKIDFFLKFDYTIEILEALGY